MIYGVCGGSGEMKLLIRSAITSFYGILRGSGSISCAVRKSLPTVVMPIMRHGLKVLLRVPLSPLFLTSSC